MSTWTQIDAGIIEPAPENRVLVDEIALAVSIRGPKLECQIKAENDAKFSFLFSSDLCHAYYQLKVSEYLAHNQDVDECVQDAPLHPKSPRPRYSRIVPFRDHALLFPAGMTPQDLDIIKLTALFVARWGPFFSLALSKRVDNNPHFEFLRSPGSISNFYAGLVGAYSRIFSRSEKVSMATVLKVFFHKVEMSTVMLHAFAGGVDCFLHWENLDYHFVMPPPELLSVTVLRLKDTGPPWVSDTPFIGYTTPGSASFVIDVAWWTALMDFCIINLTAQFVARYGPYFCCVLKKAVEKKPQFGL